MSVRGRSAVSVGLGWLLAVALIGCGQGGVAEIEGRPEGNSIAQISVGSTQGLGTADAADSGERRDESPRQDDPTTRPDSWSHLAAVPPSGEANVRPARPEFWLGIQSRPAAQDLLDQFDLQCGLIVGHVVPGGPADGHLQVADLLYQFNGEMLGCEKNLCGCVCKSGTAPVRLAVIRKAVRLEVIIQPQPIEWLQDGSIVQYTIAASDETGPGEDRPNPQVRLAGPDGQLVEKFRLFVAQPPLLVPDHASASRTSRPAAELSLERIASFRTNPDGSQVLVVQEGGRIFEYHESEWGAACEEIKELCNLIERQP